VKGDNYRDMVRARGREGGVLGGMKGDRGEFAKARSSTEGLEKVLKGKQM